MGSKKTTQLTSGTPVQPTDLIPAARGSGNVKIPASDFATAAQKGVANGYASLDSGGTVPDAQIPAAIARDSEVSTALATALAAAAAAQAASQPLDSDLTAIAALITTAYGRSLLTLADANAASVTLSIAPSGVRAQRVAILGDSRTAQNVGRAAGLWTTAARGVFVQALAMIGGNYTVVAWAGVSNDTIAQMLARLQADVLSHTPDEVWFWGGVNDANGAIAPATSIANLTSILDAIPRSVIVRVCTEPFVDSYTTAAKLNWMYQFNTFVRALPLSRRNVIVHDIARAWDNGDSTGGTPVQTQGFASDGQGVHPNDLGGQLLGRAFAADMQTLPQPMPLHGYKDLSFVTMNPQGNGSNATGANNFVITSNGSGNGPNSWGVLGSGTGAGVMSKVAHPTETYRPGTVLRAVCTGAANNDTVQFGPRDVVIDAVWASGGGTAYNQIYKPTVANGVNYRVVTTGSFAVGADPTGSWSTALGTVFTDGTVTLQVIEAIITGTSKVRALADLLLSAQTGNVAVEMPVTFYTGGYGSALLGATCLGAGNPDATTKFAYLPPRLTLVNDGIVVPVGTRIINCQVVVRMAAGAGITVHAPLIGVHKWAAS